MRKTIDITGVPVDCITMDQAVNILNKFLNEDKAHSIYTPNAEIMMAAYRDPDLKEILRAADLVIPDGAGVVLASRLLGRPLLQKVAGIELTKNSFFIKRENKLKYFFLGGKPGIAEIAAEKILESYPNVTVCGFHDGYFAETEEDKIIAQINESNPDILLVALGAPKQERWIHKNKNRLNARVCIGVGGTLDIFAGKLNEAPKFMSKHGFEWLYRLYKEPYRYKRMLDLPKYMLLILAIRLGLKKD